MIAGDPGCQTCGRCSVHSDASPADVFPTPVTVGLGDGIVSSDSGIPSVRGSGFPFHTLTSFADYSSCVPSTRLKSRAVR